MSYATTLRHAASVAQNVLRSMADPEGAGAFTYSGSSYTGVFHEQDESDPLDATGVKRIRHLYIYATKTQFATSPVGAPRTTLTARGITWSVQSVTDLPLHYRFTCRPV